MPFASFSHPFEQLLGGKLDVTENEQFGLPLRAQQRATMHSGEIAIRVVEARFGIFWLLVVDPQVPVCVFGEPITLDEGIFVCRRATVVFPVKPIVDDVEPVVDKAARLFHRTLVELNAYLRALSATAVVAAAHASRVYAPSSIALPPNRSADA